MSTPAENLAFDGPGFTLEELETNTPRANTPVASEDTPFPEDQGISIEDMQTMQKNVTSAAEFMERIRGETRASVAKSLQMGNPTLTKEVFDAIPWHYLPPGSKDNINLDLLNHELRNAPIDLLGPIGLIGVENPELGSSVRAMANLARKFTYDRPIDYVTGAPMSFRAKFGAMDTDPERIAAIEKAFGEGTATQDNQGRWGFVDPNTGIETIIDPPFLEMGDFADLAEQYPQIFGVIATAIATQGRGTGFQFVADMLASLTGFGAAELTEEALGMNLETADAVYDRMKGEAGLTALGFGVGKGVEFSVGRLKNPLFGGLNSKEILVAQQLHRINQRIAQEAARLGVKPNLIPLRPSVLNASPFLARLEGMVSKIPGGAGVMKKLREQFDNAINEEVDFLMAGMPKDLEGRAELAMEIKSLLREARDSYVGSLRSANNARYTGRDPASGDRVMTDGVNVAFEQFKSTAETRVASMAAIVGDNKFVNLRQFKNEVRGIQEKLLSLRKKGGDAFNATRFNKLQQYLELEDNLSIAGLHELRRELGDSIASLSRGLPIENLNKGEFDQLYKALNRDVALAPKRVARAGNKLTPSEMRKFNEEFKSFNEFYANGHAIFNESKGGLADILRGSTSEGIFDAFFRTGNGDKWDLIKKQLINSGQSSKWQELQDLASDNILRSKNAKSILAKMDGIGDRTLKTILGEDKVRSYRNMAGALQQVENIPFTKWLSDKKSATAMLNKWFTPNEPESIIAARKFLGPNSDAWKKIQIAYGSRLLEQAMDEQGNLVGKKLLRQMQGKNKALSDFIFQGSVLGDNLKIIGNLVTSTKSAEGGMAGGLAAGMYIVTLLSGNLLSAAGAAGITFLTAKAISTKSAKAWLTRQPLHKLTRSQIRAATESMVLLSEEN